MHVFRELDFLSQKLADSVNFCCLYED